MSSKFLEKLKTLFDAGTPTEQKPPEAQDKPEFPMPEPENYDLYDLDTLSKRKMTICNLFANHKKTIPEIINLLEASPKLVIQTLIDHKLLKDRRKAPRPRTPAPEELQK